MYFNFFFLFLLFLIFLQKYMYSYGMVFFDRFYPNSDFNEYKKKYIIKNICKSYLLFTLFFSTTLPLFCGFFLNEWSNFSFYVCGCFYTAIDLGGLIYVKGLPKATVIHHTTVGIIGILNLLTDYNKHGYYKSFLIYCYFSIIPFIVNFYLGSRYLIHDSNKRKFLAKLSYLIYTFSLVLNIICEIILFYNNEYSWTIYFYILLFLMIFNDDITLIRFLRKESIDNKN